MRALLFKYGVGVGVGVGLAGREPTCIDKKPISFILMAVFVDSANALKDGSMI